GVGGIASRSGSSVVVAGGLAVVVEVAEGVPGGEAPGQGEGERGDVAGDTQAAQPVALLGCAAAVGGFGFAFALAGAAAAIVGASSVDAVAGVVVAVAAVAFADVVGVVAGHVAHRAGDGRLLGHWGVPSVSAMMTRAAIPFAAQRWPFPSSVMSMLMMSVQSLS